MKTQKLKSRKGSSIYPVNTATLDKIFGTLVEAIYPSWQQKFRTDISLFTTYMMNLRNSFGVISPSKSKIAHVSMLWFVVYILRIGSPLR